MTALFAVGVPLDAAWSQALPLPAGTVLTGPVYRAGNPKNCVNKNNPYVPSITTGADANAYTCNDVYAPNLPQPKFPSFEPGAPGAMVVTATPTQYVRFWFTDNTNGKCGPYYEAAKAPFGYLGSFMAQPSAVRGMTPAQIAAALALPGVPDHITTVLVPQGACVLSSLGGPAFGQPGGPQQFWLAGKPSGPNCYGLDFYSNSGIDIYANRGLLGPYALLYAPFAGGGNAGAVAAALDRGPYAAPFSQMDEIYKSLDLLNFGTDNGPLRGALAQLDGEIYADYPSVAIAAGQQMLSAVMTEMRTPAATTAKPIQLWFSALGGGTWLSGNGDTHDLTAYLGGFAGGVEGRVNPSLFGGVALGYQTGIFGDNLNDRASTFAVTPYARYAPGPWYVQGAIGYSYNWGGVNRSLSFVNYEYYSSGVTFATHGSPKGNAFLTQAETGYRMDVNSATAVTPFVGLQGVAFFGDSFTETGGGAVDLHVAGKTTNQWVSLLGGEVAFTQSVPAPITLTARVAWACDLSGTQRSATAWLDGTPSMAAFTVQGASAARNAAYFSLGANGKVAGVDAFARYEGAVGSGSYGQSATVGVRASF